MTTALTHLWITLLLLVVAVISGLWAAGVLQLDVTCRACGYRPTGFKDAVRHQMEQHR